MRPLDTGTEELRAHVEDGVAVLVLHRPERCNALTPAICSRVWRTPKPVLASRPGELMLFADRLDARAALELGLVDAVLPDDALLGHPRLLG